MWIMEEVLVAERHMIVVAVVDGNVGKEIAQLQIII